MKYSMDGPELSLSNESLLEHSAWVRRVAMDLVRDPVAADDLVQETWLALLRAKPDTNRPLRPWLARVVRNAAALRARRRAGREAREQCVALTDDAPSSDELVERAEEQRRLVDMVLALKDPYRSTLLLRYYEGLTPTQIARVRGLPGATVRTHLRRGLAEMRDRLDGEHGGNRKAWIAMLQPWFQSKAPALGVGLIATGVVATVLVLILGLSQIFTETGAPAIEQAEGDFGLSGAAGTQLSRDVEFARAEIPFASEAPTARELHLHDETGRPLAHYSIQVDGRDLTSDDRGVVTIEGGAKSLLPIDDPRLAIEVSVSHERRRRVRPLRERIDLRQLEAGDLLEVPTGPEYQLRLSGMGALHHDQLEATLGPVDLRGGQFPVQLAPVRVRGSKFRDPWVRFSGRPGGRKEAPGKWKLELRDGDGYWSGTTEFDALPVSPPRELTVALVNTAVVQGQVSGVHAGEWEDIQVVLVPPGEDPGALSRCTLEEDGEFFLGWMHGGEYTLQVISPRHEPWSMEVLLSAGEHTFQAVQLEPTISAGRVGGMIRSESGAYGGQLLVFLLDDGGETIDVYPTTWRQSEEGRTSASFLFENTPPGDLHLDVVSLADAVTFDGSAGSFRAPFERVELTVQDQLPSSDWSFEVLDESTGLELTDFSITVRIPGGVDRIYQRTICPREPDAEWGKPVWTLLAGGLRWNQFTNPAPLRAFPDGVPFSWVVGAPGYEDAEGDSLAFDSLGPGRLRARVSMTPNL